MQRSECWKLLGSRGSCRGSAHCSLRSKPIPLLCLPSAQLGQRGPAGSAGHVGSPGPPARRVEMGMGHLQTPVVLSAVQPGCLLSSRRSWYTCCDPLGAALLGRPQGTLCHSQTGALPSDRSPSRLRLVLMALGSGPLTEAAQPQRWHGDGIQLCSSHLGQDGNGSLGSVSPRSGFEGSDAVAY